MEILVGMFKNKNHADVCLSNLKEADFEAQGVEFPDCSLVILEVEKETLSAAREMMEDHKADKIDILEVGS